jgi:hypothetical protein
MASQTLFELLTKDKVRPQNPRQISYWITQAVESLLRPLEDFNHSDKEVAQTPHALGVKNVTKWHERHVRLEASAEKWEQRINKASKPCSSCLWVMILKCLKSLLCGNSLKKSQRMTLSETGLLVQAPKSNTETGNKSHNKPS